MPNTFQVAMATLALLSTPARAEIDTKNFDVFAQFPPQERLLAECFIEGSRASSVGDSIENFEAAQCTSLQTEERCLQERSSELDETAHIQARLQLIAFLIRDNLERNNGCRLTDQ